MSFHTLNARKNEIGAVKLSHTENIKANSNKLTTH